MKYYKVIEDDYIIAIGTGEGQTEITFDEYETLLNIINEKPIANDGYDYKLKTDLAWEEYELTIIEEVENREMEEIY